MFVSVQAIRAISVQGASRAAFAGAFLLAVILAGCTHRVVVTLPERPIEIVIRVQQEEAMAARAPD